jgi:cytochrome b561
MHADVDNALILDGKPDRSRRDAVLYCGLAGLIVLVGVLGLLPDAWLTLLVESRTALHVLFGLLLCGLILVRFRWWLMNSPPAQAADIRLFSRQLSRMVYLVLYFVTGGMEVINIVGALRDDTQAARGLAILGPCADGQAFLICGLIALVSIRVLAYWSWRRLVLAVRQ